MRLLALVVILLLSTVVSCKKEKQPQGILSRPEMVDWMIDIYLAEARLQLMSLGHDSAYKLFVPFQDSLLRKKSLQDSVLKKSYQYYLDHPSELEVVYDAVIDSLSLREQRLRKASVNP